MALSTEDLENLFGDLDLGPVDFTAPAPAADAPAVAPAVAPAADAPALVPALVPAAPEAAMGGQAPPSLSRQKTYIIANAGNLSQSVGQRILRVTMQEVGRDVVLEQGTNKEVNIDLDALGTKNPDALTRIYNIVRAHLETLNQPARQGLN